MTEKWFRIIRVMGFTEDRRWKDLHLILVFYRGRAPGLTWSNFGLWLQRVNTYGI